MHKIAKGIKYLRGQVWYVDFSGLRDENSKEYGVICKSRPCLIVSNNTNNSNNYAVNVLPITSGSYYNNINSVGIFEFLNPDTGNVNKIICSQITTVSKNRLGSSYLYSFDNDTMNEISRLMIESFSLTSVEETTINVGIPTEQLIVENFVSEKAVVTNTEEKIQDSIVGNPETKPVVLEVEKELNPVTETKSKLIVNKKAKMLKGKNKVVSMNAKREKHQKWAETEKLKFLKYLDEHGIIKTAKEYNISQGTVYTYKWSFMRDYGEKMYMLDFSQLPLEVVAKKYKMSIKEAKVRYTELSSLNSKNDTTNK